MNGNTPAPISDESIAVPQARAPFTPHPIPLSPLRGEGTRLEASEILPETEALSPGRAHLEY
jgi:hypothetical protein